LTQYYHFLQYYYLIFKYKFKNVNNEFFSIFFSTIIKFDQIAFAKIDLASQNKEMRSESKSMFIKKRRVSWTAFLLSN